MTSAKPSTVNASLSTNRTESATGVLAALADSEPVLEELRAASRLPYSRFNLRYDNDNPADIVLPHLAILKRLCQILQLRASAELALGRTDQASEDISFIFRLADATRDEPFLITHQLRLGELLIGLQPLAEGLARHQWSEAQLRAFEQRLLQFDLCADGRHALEGERAFCGGVFIDYLRRSPNRYRALTGNGGGPSGGGQSSFDWQSALMAVVPSGWFYFEKLNYSRMFQDDLLSTIDVPGRRVSADACGEAEERLGLLCGKPWPARLLRHQSIVSVLLPGLSRAAQRFAFAQAGTDAAAVACALERYRLARGQFPDSLGALMPDYLNRLPHDVIDGQPLKYRRTADGQYVLYSVGWNKTDDGGVVGLKQKSEAVDQTVGDWVWRLPVE